MRILVACEESQAVTIELRRLGHEAYSCDIIPCSGGHPEWHLKQDVIPLLTRGGVGHDHCISAMHALGLQRSAAFREETGGRQAATGH